MRFMAYEVEGGAGLGVRTEQGIVATGHGNLRDYLQGGDAAVTRLQRLLGADPPTVTPDRLRVPRPDRAALICCGGN